LHAVLVAEFSGKETYLIKNLREPTLLPMMPAFVSMLISMGMVSMVVIVMILVPKACLSQVIAPRTTFQLLLGLGHESFKLSTIEPDSPAHLADIYSDAITVLFFKSRFVASRTNHVNSFFMFDSPGIDI
jgi:hypothetical protein